MARTIIEKVIGAVAQQDDYHKALGHFMTIFSDMEARMQEVLRHLAGVSEDVAKAIFSGVRIDAASNYITRIGDATNWPEAKKNTWNEISTRLGHLSFLRNQIVHYGAQWQDVDTWVITNELVAHIAENATKIPVSPTILADATADLEKLDCHLFAFAWPEMYVRHKNDMDETLKRAWRYKPPLQVGRRQKTRDKSPKQRHQRES